MMEDQVVDALENFIKALIAEAMDDNSDGDGAAGIEAAIRREDLITVLQKAARKLR